MASSHSEIDRDLNILFDKCAREGRDEADINELASICAEKYAPGQTELKLIILQKIQNPEGNQLITRSEFIAKVKEWISEKSPPIEENEWTSVVIHNSSSDYSDCGIEHAIYSSTPLHARPKMNQGFRREGFYDKLNCDHSESSDKDSPIRILKLEMSREREVLKDRTNTIQYNLVQTEQKLHKMKDKNVSLETRLTRSEQRNQSLEQEVKKLSNDLNQKIQSFNSENKRLNSVISELNDNCKQASEECHKLRIENQKLKSELESCQCKELLPKASELQQELDSLKTTYLSDLRNKDLQINGLYYELNSIKESDETNKKMVDSLRTENMALLSNQEELLETIGKLREEKQELQEQLDEVAPLESLRLGSFNSADFGSIDGDEHRESGISVRSIFHEGVNLEPLEQIFDDSNSQSHKTNDNASQIDDYHAPLSSEMHTIMNAVKTNESCVSSKTNDNSSQTDGYLASVRSEMHNALVQTNESCISFKTNDNANQTDIYLPSVRSEMHNAIVQTNDSCISCKTNDNSCQTGDYLASVRSDMHNAIVQTNDSCISCKTNDSSCQTDDYLASVRSEMHNAIVQTNDSCISCITNDNSWQTDDYPASVRSEMHNAIVQTNDIYFSSKTNDNVSQTDGYTQSMRIEMHNVLVQTNKSCIRNEMRNVILQTNESCISHKTNDNASQTDVFLASMRSEMRSVILQTNESCISHKTNDNASQTDVFLASVRSEMRSVILQTNESCISFTTNDNASQGDNYVASVRTNSISGTSNRRGLSLFRKICYLSIICIILLFVTAFYDGQSEIVRSKNVGPLPH